MRLFLVAWFTVVLIATAGCSAETESTATTSPTTVDEQHEPATDKNEVSAVQSSSITTSLTSTTTATTAAAPTTTTAATATTQPTGTDEPAENVEEAIGPYGEWELFWSVFSEAAAVGDIATVDALTASELTFVYAGGSVSTWKGSKEEFIGSFARPQEVFEDGRQTLSDGTIFRAELRTPGQWSSFHGFGIDYDIAYSVFIEEGDGGPATASEYIFRNVDGEFLFVGYSADS